MRLRIILPPNLESCAPRDAIPTKLEVESDNGKISQPEKIPMDALGSLSESERVAAFSLLQWCGGKLGSFLQLDREKLSQLIDALSGEASFFWANKPKQPIDWVFSELVGVSEFVAQEEEEKTAESKGEDSGPSLREAAGIREPVSTPKPSLEESFDGTPPVVDGSSHYLAIKLPSREHPYYDEFRELLQGYRFKLEPANRKWWLRDRHQTLNFLGEHWGDLENRYGVDFTENFLSRTESLKDADIRTEVTEERNGYTVAVSVIAGQASEQQISQSFNTGRHYVEDGDKVYLVKKQNLEKLHGLQQVLAESPDAPLLHHGRYQIPHVRTPQIEENLAELNPNFNPPKTWRERSVALKDLSSLATPRIPKGLVETLRPYQKIGVSWLHHLFKNKLGGILADEMGLGKTIQAISLLASLKESGKQGTSLVICPASLVENWRRESVKFAPKLRVIVNHGSQRIKKAEDLNGYDLVITSYGTLIRDQKKLADTDFLCVIGDEAQHIKNKRTRNAKAISSLHTQGRFLLTGTPIENSIQDLISLLDFIMPGSWKGIPSGARGGERKWHEQRIQDQAAPYILRRSKLKVAPELPEKIEQVIFVDMTKDQKATYDNARRSASEEISALESSGASEGAVRMKTLTQLLRLRQVCCDPRILDDKLPADASPKLSSFLELLEEAIDGGHRILVFSQFVSILSLLKKELDSQQIPYCYIDGKTKDRMAEVDRFNDEDDIPLFLISLKAGGTGLNLTAADTVIHFDPWWNPAVEAQATDRAHRIGQDKIVTSYKLIVSGSVEEKVLQMQGEKKKLLENIFEASEAANSRISLEDMKNLF
ncbi:DEAD/DEAH box helicase [Puniceicoccaceae bacterium K14]|nr:DEAD/DEAH box helicase [Puniceicoccaceae bacterium K14]